MHDLVLGKGVYAAWASWHRALASAIFALLIITTPLATLKVFEIIKAFERVAEAPSLKPSEVARLRAMLAQKRDCESRDTFGVELEGLRARLTNIPASQE